MNKQKTKRYDVTDMTPSQRLELFRECIDQKGFIGFVKNQSNQHIHYIFQYYNSA